MAYQYYQSAYPGWGTTPVQFGAPPVPGFQPSSTWGGWDYYNAHAINPDRSLWQSIVDRVRGYTGLGGVGLHQARSWHNRIYSGLINLGQVLPADIGAAAAYEAYRMWRHHHSILLSPLGGGMEKEREALTGLAVAEASRLWQYSGRPMDTYGLRAALESAALTASRISYRVMEEERDELMSTSSGYMDSNYPYQHHHRHRRSSFDNGTGAPIIVAGGGVPSMSYGTPLTSTMPLPGVAGTMVGGGSPYGGIYGGTQGMYPGAVGSISGTYPGIYNTNPAPYGSVPGAYGQPVYTAPYTSGGLLANPYGVTNAGGYALSYDGTPVVGGAYTSPYGGNVYAGQSAAPSVIIQPGRRHHHRHHSH